MIRMATMDLEPGLKNARNIYHSDGQLLLAQDVLLTHRYIQRLIDLNIPYVYIENPYVELVEPPESLKEATRIKTIKLIEQSFRKVQQVNKINPAMIQSITQLILEDIATNPTTLIHLTELRNQAEAVYSHSVNTSVFSVLLAQALGYDRKKQTEIVTGALLHDIGKMLLAQEPKNQGGQLTEESKEELKAHAELGFYFLRKNGTGIPLLSLHMVYQHHENFDGSGYPRQIKGAEIHEYARILAIVNAYDQLIASNHESAMLPHEACEVLISGSGISYDPFLLAEFLKRIALYPVGTYVQLNTGQIGIVAAIPEGLPTRPIIKVLSNGPLQGQNVDLQKHLTVFVDRVLSGKDILQFHRS